MAFITGALQGAQRVVAHAIAVRCEHSAAGTYVRRGDAGRAAEGHLQPQLVLGARGRFPALPGGHVTMYDNVFVVAVWHRVGIRIPTDMPCARRASHARAAAVWPPSQTMPWSTRR